jgi:2-oxo-4-hydroxy-4-carboxy-5-ureidoimidazoline decarboxylase
MTEVLTRWNALPFPEATNQILPCCGSKTWAEGMAARRPLSDEATLLATSDEICRNLADSDWMEAFRSHPRIGESKPESAASSPAASWSADEQSSVSRADDAVKMALARASQEYERRFGRIFIVCATGKSPEEIWQILERRLRNDRETEFREAAEQQRQITQIRLKKWLKA